MAQETDVALNLEDLEAPERRNGRAMEEPREGSWTSLAEGHRDLFRLETSGALDHWRRLVLRAAAVIFSAALAVVFMNLAALYALNRAGLSWGAAFLISGLAWLAAAAGVMWAAKRAPRFIAFGASRRQAWETAQWLLRRLF